MPEMTDQKLKKSVAAMKHYHTDIVDVVFDKGAVYGMDKFGKIVVAINDESLEIMIDQMEKNVVGTQLIF